MFILRIMPILCALLFILLQKVSIKIKTQDEVTVRIDLSIIALIFSGSKKSKFRPKSIKSLFNYFPAIYRAAKYAIKKSEVYIFTRQNKANDDLKIEYVHSYSANPLQLIYPFLLFNSKRVCLIDNSTYSKANSSKPDQDFNLSLELPLISLINSALVFLYYIMKNKVKRVVKNVRYGRNN